MANSCGVGGWSGPLPGDPDNSSVLNATPQFGGIEIFWTMPSSNGYAVSYTTLYRSSGSNFALAIPMAYVSGDRFFDRTAADLIQPYYYWVQHVSINGTVLDVIGPVAATAKPLLEQVLTDLQGQVDSTHLAESLRGRIDKIADLELGLTNLSTLVVDDNTALAQQILGMRNDLTNTVAYVAQQQQVEAGYRQAFVQTVNQQLAEVVSPDLGPLRAAVEEETQLRAQQTGELFGQRALKFDLNGNVSGTGFAASVDPSGAANSAFTVRADSISFAPPSVSSNTAPLNTYNGMIWVDTSQTPNVTKWFNKTASAWQTTPVLNSGLFVFRTTPEVVNGYTIDPGLYISGAYIDKISSNQLDTRGLVIRAADGTPIFGGGTLLDWVLVGGAGKPETGATRNVYRGSWAAGQTYTKGDVVIKDGYGWSSQAAHISSAGNAPPVYPVEANATWVIAAVKGGDGASGFSAIACLVSNESHTLPATSAGVVSSYVGSGTQIRVYEGSTLLEYDGTGTANGTWKVAVVGSNITPGPNTDSGAYLTVGDHTAFLDAQDLAMVTYTVTGKSTAGVAFTFTKVQSLSKSKAGSKGDTGTKGDAGDPGTPGDPGATGPTVAVNPNRAASFTATDGSLDASQADLVFTADVTGIAAPTYAWSFAGLQTNPTASTTNSQTITADQFGSAKSATVTCTVSGQYKDVFTIVRLEKSTAAAGATVGAPTGTQVGGVAAETLVANVNDKLSKYGGQLLGTINFAIPNGLFAGTDINNGVYYGNQGILGKKNGQVTFAISTDGSVVVKGDISGSTGTFGGLVTGQLSGATGTYSGLLTAQAINAVDTINLRGNSVTIPTNAQWVGTYSGYAEIVATPFNDFQNGSVIVVAQLEFSKGGLDDAVIHPGVCIFRNGQEVAAIPWQAVGVFIDQPGPGNHKYGVGSLFGNTGGTTVTAAKIFVLGAKR